MSFEGGRERTGSVVPFILLAIAIVFLYGFGIYNMWILILPWLPTLNTILSIALPFLAGYWWVALAFILFIVFLGVIFAYIILRLMKRAAIGTLKVLWILQGVAMLIIGVFFVVLFFPFGLFGLFFSLIGVLQFFVWFRYRRKIERAGKLVEFTATLLLEERQMFLVPLVTAIFSMITGLLMGSTLFVMYLILPTLGVGYESWITFIVELLIFAAYIFIYYMVFYIFEGVNVSIAHTWYREKDPNLRGALGEVRQVSGTLVKFAGARTGVALLQMAFRRGGQRAGGPGEVVGAVVSGIIGAIWRFLTYFALPIIIIEKHGLVDSIKRSARLTWNYLVDVYIAETGVATVYSFFGGLLTLGYMAVGFIFGYILGFIFIADLFIAIIIGIVFAFLFMIFAAIPSHFIFRPLNTAYRTFMFAYAMDEESGFTRPSRLPKAYADTIEEAQAEWEASGKKRGIQAPPDDW